MKIAFVNDSCERLGIGYLSSLLKQSGHDVQLFVDPLLFDDEFITNKRLNRLFDKKDRIISELKDYKPDLVGISVVTGFYQWALTMARMIKEEMDVPVIFGGIHPTSVPERVIQNDCVDMVCVGEGEYPMLELADSMEQGKINTSIRNIWFKKDGQVIANEVRPLIDDLDSLPMPDKELYYSASPHFSQCYYIMASRGCLYACSYCCHSYLRQLYRGKGIYLRHRSVDNVIEELRSAGKRYKFRYLRFFDESFGTDIEWLREFSVKYRNSIKLPFLCYMHPDHVSPESLKYLKDAGCCEIEMGVQSGTEKIRSEVLNRHMPDQMIHRAINLIKKEKISLVTDNIFGLPGESRSDITDLARLYNEKRVNRIYFFWLRFYPKIAITEMAKEKKLVDDVQYSQILDGQNRRSFSRGGDVKNKSLNKIHALFFIIPFLPKRIVRWIIKAGLYEHFPAFLSCAFIPVLTSLFSSSFNDRLLRRKEITRYCRNIIKVNS